MSRNLKKVIKNTGTLAVGVASGKLFAFLAMPIITRTYVPSDLGKLSIFSSIIVILAPLATMRYVVAIPLPRRNRVALQLVWLCSIFIFLYCIFLSLILCLFGEKLFGFLGLPSLNDVWWLIVAAVFGASFYEVGMLWATRTQNFKAISFTQAYQSIVGQIIKISLYFSPWQNIGLLLGQTAQQSFGFLRLWREIVNYKNAEKYSYKANKKILKILLNKYSDLPRFRLLSQFLLILSAQAPLLLFSVIFTTSQTGQLGLALSSLALPISVIGQTASKAYYSEIAFLGKQRGEEILQLTAALVKRLFFISIVPALMLVIFGKEIFALMFGEAWKEAGVFASALSFYMVFQFVSAPIMNVYTLYQKQKKFLEINVVRFFVVAAVFSLSYYFDFDATSTIIFYSFGLSLHYIAIMFRVNAMIKSEK